MPSLIYSFTLKAHNFLKLVSPIKVRFNDTRFIKIPPLEGSCECHICGNMVHSESGCALNQEWSMEDHFTQNTVDSEVKFIITVVITKSLNGIYGIYELCFLED